MIRAPDDEVLLEAMRAIVRISLHAADGLDGVSVVQLRALTLLERDGHANMAGLAEGMGVTVSTTSRMVDRLVAAGLVQRRMSKHTRREVDLRLTPRGRELLERYDTLRLQGLHACLAELPALDRDAAIGGLRTLGAAART